MDPMTYLYVSALIFIAGIVTLRLGNRKLDEAKKVLEDAIETDKEANELADRLEHEYDLNDDPLDSIMEGVDEKAGRILEATIEDLRLELGHELSEDVVECLTIFAAMTDQYNPSIVAKAMFAYADYAHNLKMAGLMPQRETDN